MIPHSEEILLYINQFLLYFSMRQVFTWVYGTHRALGHFLGIGFVLPWKELLHAISISLFGKERNFHCKFCWCNLTYASILSKDTLKNDLDCRKIDTP